MNSIIMIEIPQGLRTLGFSGRFVSTALSVDNAIAWEESADRDFLDCPHQAAVKGFIAQAIWRAME